MSGPSQLRDSASDVLSNIVRVVCHYISRLFLERIAAGALALAAMAGAQTPPVAPEIAPVRDLPQDWIEVSAVTQIKEGEWFRLRGAAALKNGSMVLRADEIDYNERDGYAEARGNVYLKRYTEGEELWADRVEYNLADETGKFYNVRGVTPLKVAPRPGVLRTDNPFYFQGEWAERIKDRYILHEGFITNCKLPNPWWSLTGPKFDVIPNDRAIAHRAVFRIRRIPLFYAPIFYKSLERMPRKSGLLTPNLGNSSRRGRMVGGGYYWAINRSYDATYRGQYFSARGIAHHVDFRGKPRAGTDFNFVLYGVNDRGMILEDGSRGAKEGGALFSFDMQSDLGDGWMARADANYLSSLRFRQAFTESFNEAIFSEVHSIGFLTRQWSTFGLDFVFQRNENLQSAQKSEDKIVIRKLPQAQFSSRDRLIWDRGLPVWFSFDSSAGLLRRDQLLFQTRQFLERADFQPRIMTALRWKDFHILPSFSIRETHWGESMRDGRVVGENINRHARQVSVALVPPSLERIFDAPGWLGDKVKHVIEPRASFRHVAGVDDFDRFIRFDETEIYSNTTEADISLTNRFLVKRNNVVEELLSWELRQRRYFDPDFGGAVKPGRRNVVLSAAEMTTFAFLDGPRNYSPVVSVLRVSPRPGFGLEWRADYDPLRKRIVNNGITADGRFSRYFASLGYSSIRAVPLDTPGNRALAATNPCATEFTGVMQLLSPCANELRGRLGAGNETRRGWNAAFDWNYDVREGVMRYATTQVTYNTDCCGISFQYRRFGFGSRHGENQYLVAFSVANFASFGTLKKQERLF